MPPLISELRRHITHLLTLWSSHAQQGLPTIVDHPPLVIV
jgi:hypothetical protein